MSCGTNQNENGNPPKKWTKYVPLMGAVLGAAAGFLYFWFVGCADGTCAITSDPFVSTLYGGLIGLLLGFTVSPNKKGPITKSPFG